MAKRAEEALHAAEIDRIERKILQLALKRTNSRNGAIFLWEKGKQALSVDFHVVEGVEIPVPLQRIERRAEGEPSGVAFHVAETERPYLTNDAQTDPHYTHYFLEVGSIAAVPILYQRRAIGVISVSAVPTGAYDPQDLAELEALAASSARFLRRAQLYRQTRDQGEHPILIKGLSPEWQVVEELIEQVSPTQAPVLIRGESGTGKELVARAIHFNSGRADEPFVAINCAAIPEQLLESMLFGHTKGAFTGAAFAKKGEFEKADGGTLFLDELGELGPSLQAKLLRTLQQGEVQPLGSDKAPQQVDVRVLAATNRDLETMRAGGEFRDDLYFRLAVITIRTPPLRTYLENLEVLCQVFVTRANATHGREVNEIAPEALRLLRSYDFPGNMRELGNVLEHATIVAKGNRIEPHHLPIPSAPRKAPRKRKRAARPTLAELRKTWVAERERAHLTEVLEETEGNVPKAAKLLGIDRTTLYRLLKKYGIRVGKRVLA